MTEYDKEHPGEWFEKKLNDKVNNCSILKEADLNSCKMPDECDKCELRVPGWIWLCVALKETFNENRKEDNSHEN